MRAIQYYSVHKSKLTSVLHFVHGQPRRRDSMIQNVCSLCPWRIRRSWKNFQMFYAYVRQIRKLPSPKVSAGKLRNKGINKLCTWCNVFGFVWLVFNFLLMHLRKKQIPWISQYDMAKQTPWIPAAVATEASCPLSFVLLRGNVGWHTTFKS